MPLDTDLLGQPVGLGQVSRELKRLWEATGGTKSRASLVNFAVYGEGQAALKENTRLISEFTRQHACRAILLASVETAETSVSAFINAHCHLGHAGAKQICCEQITFLFPPASTHLLSNVLFANLDSDLPLYLWWQGEFDVAVQDQLWTWVDRLIFDSRDWRCIPEQLTLVRKLVSRSGARLILCDLNWTRTLHLRQAIAQIFDHPDHLNQIPFLQSLIITHDVGHRSTALLLVGWISAQLQWKNPVKGDGEIRFTTEGENRISVKLIESAGACISACEFTSAEICVSLLRDQKSSFYRLEIQEADGRTTRHALPAGSCETGALLDDELTFGGRHRVYLKALAAAEGLF